MYVYAVPMEDLTIQAVGFKPCSIKTQFSWKLAGKQGNGYVCSRKEHDLEVKVSCQDLHVAGDFVTEYTTPLGMRLHVSYIITSYHCFSFFCVIMDNKHRILSAPLPLLASYQFVISRGRHLLTLSKPLAQPSPELFLHGQQLRGYSHNVYPSILLTPLQHSQQTPLQQNPKKKSYLEGWWGRADYDDGWRQQYLVEEKKVQMDFILQHAPLRRRELTMQRFLSTGIQLRNYWQKAKDRGSNTLKTKEKVYDLIMEYLDAKGHPSETRHVC